MSGGCFVGCGPRVALVGGGEFGLTGALDCNVYLLRTSTGGVLLDTGAGTDTTRLLANLTTTGVSVTQLAAILLKHGHLDHAGGVAAIAGEAGTPVYAAADEAQLLSAADADLSGLTAAKLTGTYPQDIELSPYSGTRTIQDGEPLDFGDLQVQSLITPGHSRGSTVWHASWPDYTALFTGDTVFQGGSTSILNVEGSCAADLRRSIPRLARTSFHGLFPGHGPFVLRGGADHVRLAAARVQASVIPNRAVPGYRPSPQIEALAARMGGEARV